jgi:hypothetical protein
MFEVRIHGRGGQGAVTAAGMLSVAAFLEGRHAQAFPSFARTARRLGATDAVVVYRRTRERMPAHDIEVEEAAEEGVRMKWLSTIAHADGGTLTIERMRLDDNGFPQPTGEYEELAADSVILALGQESDLSALHIPGLRTAHGAVAVDGTLMTGHRGIFAGGDLISGAHTVTDAIGHGKKAARHIDAYLRGTVFDPGPRPAPATFDALNTWYYSDAPAAVRPGWKRPGGCPPSTRSPPDSTKPPPGSRPGAACRAATASNATTATACARTMPSPHSARAMASPSTTTTAKAAACA